MNKVLTPKQVRNAIKRTAKRNSKNSRVARLVLAGTAIAMGVANRKDYEVLFGVKETNDSR